MRNELNQERPDFSQPCQPPTESFAKSEDLFSSVSHNTIAIFKDDAMRDIHLRAPALDSRIAAVRQRRSRRIILLTIALAASLSICSVRWIMEKKTVASVAKVIPPTPGVVDEPSVPEAVVPTETAVVKEKAEHHVSKAVVADPAKKFRKDWWQYISADHSSYAYGVLGGISDLSVVVSNKTDYVLDEVTAKVTIMKANGKPWKTKTVTIYAVPAHSDKKELLPKLSRGKSVEVILMKIISKKMHFSYPGNSKNSGDPYYMN